MIITKEIIFKLDHPECKKMNDKEFRNYLKRECSCCSICPITKAGEDCNKYEFIISPKIKKKKIGRHIDIKPKECFELVENFLKTPA